MKAIGEVKNGFELNEYDKLLMDIYADDTQLKYQRDRYIKALDKFESLYGAKDIAIYSAPGRSEVGGNHTDHQHGQVLACAVNLDAIGIVSPREDGQIVIVSDSFVINPIDTANLSKVDSEEGTSEALIRGVTAKININKISY